MSRPKPSSRGEPPRPRTTGSSPRQFCEMPEGLVTTTSRLSLRSVRLSVPWPRRSGKKSSGDDHAYRNANQSRGWAGEGHRQGQVRGGLRESKPRLWSRSVQRRGEGKDHLDRRGGGGGGPRGGGRVHARERPTPQPSRWETER